jgi:hypothetical protein
VPAVETFGVEPIPAELRTTGWRDLFAINFTFFLNPVMYVVGAIADGIAGAEVHVIRGANHSTIFDSSEEHNRVVADFFARH